MLNKVVLLVLSVSLVGADNGFVKHYEADLMKVEKIGTSDFFCCRDYGAGPLIFWEKNYFGHRFEPTLKELASVENAALEYKRDSFGRFYHVFRYEKGNRVTIYVVSGGKNGFLDSDYVHNKCDYCLVQDDFKFIFYYDKDTGKLIESLPFPPRNGVKIISQDEYCAVITSDLRYIRTLILNDQLSNKYILAVLCGDRKELDKLLGENHDDIERDYLGFTPMHWAAFLGQVDMIGPLAKAGYSVDDNDNSFNFSPMHLAVLGNRFNAVDKLVSLGASLNGRDENGLTPLHLAVSSSQVAMVEKLLKQGADVSPLNQYDESALDTAKRMELESIVKLLSGK